MKTIDFDQIFSEAREKVSEFLFDSSKTAWDRLPWRTRLMARIELFLDPVAAVRVHQQYGAALACSTIEANLTKALMENGRQMTPAEVAQIIGEPGRPVPRSKEIH